MLNFKMLKRLLNQVFYNEVHIYLSLNEINPTIVEKYSPNLHICVDDP